MKNKRALEIDRRATFRASSEKFTFSKQLAGVWRDLEEEMPTKSEDTNSYRRLLLMVLADDSTEFGEIVGDEDAQTPFELLIDKNLRDEVSDLLEVLDDRERKIIFQRFARDGGKPKTLEEVGKKCGLTRERIRQLQNIDTAAREKAVMTRLILAALSGLITAFAAICSTVIYVTVLEWRYIWLAVCVAGLVASVMFLWKACERF